MAKDLEMIKTNMGTIESLARTQLPKPNKEVIEEGLSISKLATAHPSEVAMTPVMKNMLQAFGDIGEGERLKTDAPKTRAEKWLDQTVEQLLLEQCGKRLDSYNTTLPLLSPEHYLVDCWLNFDPKKWRDIQPGQVEEINDMIKDQYAKPTPVIDLFTLGGGELSKAVELVSDDLPKVHASHEIREINLPFMTKHTNVGYPYFRNDRTEAMNAHMTYAQLTMQEAERHKDDIRWLFDNNVTTEFARYQRGKGRLIQAVSRRVNLVLNQLESVEIQSYKAKSTLFAGYNDASHLRGVLEEMTRFCASRGYGMYNIDYHRYDAHVSREWIKLIGAMSMDRCVDSRSEELAKARAALMTRTLLVAGTLGRALEVYGRIFSGFIDTNRGGGLINATNMLTLLMKQDAHYVRDIVAQVRHWMLVMGDDNLAITPSKFDLPRLQKDASLFGFEIDDASKIAFGPKFLQYRLFDDDGNNVMIYPWTRVLRSMLFKERQSGLGPCGWTLAFYQQLAKLKESPKYLAPVVNIIAYFDNNHLMLDRTVPEIIKGTREEDAEAVRARKARLDTTARRLFDGDPSKAEQFDASGELQPNYFTDVQNAIKAVYDPSYFSKHGISAPSLRGK